MGMIGIGREVATGVMDVGSWFTHTLHILMESHRVFIDRRKLGDENHDAEHYSTHRGFPPLRV